MEPGVGIEPTTYALQVRCSTTELTRQGDRQFSAGEANRARVTSYVAKAAAADTFSDET